MKRSRGLPAFLGLVLAGLVTAGAGGCASPDDLALKVGDWRGSEAQLTAATLQVWDMQRVSIADSSQAISQEVTNLVTERRQAQAEGRQNEVDLANQAIALSADKAVQLPQSVYSPVVMATALVYFGLLVELGKDVGVALEPFDQEAINAAFGIPSDQAAKTPKLNRDSRAALTAIMIQILLTNDQPVPEEYHTIFNQLTPEQLALAQERIWVSPRLGQYLPELLAIVPDPDQQPWLVSPVGGGPESTLP